MKSTNVKFTIAIPFDKPNSNRTIITKDVIENAINNTPAYLPITYNGQVIGTTTGDPIIAAWDFENSALKATFSGVLFNCGVNIMPNEWDEAGNISDCRITNIGVYL